MKVDPRSGPARLLDAPRDRSPATAPSGRFEAEIDEASAEPARAAGPRARIRELLDDGVPRLSPRGLDAPEVETEGLKPRKPRPRDGLDASFVALELPVHAARVARGIAAEHGVASRALLDAHERPTARPGRADDAEREARKEALAERREAHEPAEVTPREDAPPDERREPAAEARPAEPDRPAPAAPGDARPDRVDVERTDRFEAAATGPEAASSRPEPGDLPTLPNFVRLGDEQLRVEIDRDLSLDLAVRADGVEVTVHGTPQAIQDLQGMDADLERRFDAEGESLASYSEHARDDHDAPPDHRGPPPDAPSAPARPRRAWRGLIDVVA